MNNYQNHLPQTGSKIRYIFQQRFAKSSKIHEFGSICNAVDGSEPSASSSLVMSNTINPDCFRTCFPLGVYLRGCGKIMFTFRIIWLAVILLIGPSNVLTLSHIEDYSSVNGFVFFWKPRKVSKKLWSSFARALSLISFRERPISDTSSVRGVFACFSVTSKLSYSTWSLSNSSADLPADLPKPPSLAMYVGCPSHAGLVQGRQTSIPGCSAHPCSPGHHPL